MSILDDAIREHLELKRAHGADEAEVKRLEDEAFGPPGRPEEPDPAAEAPTEFMAAPEVPGAEPGEEGGRRINIADLQEAPPEPAESEGEPAQAEEPQADAEPLAPAEDLMQAATPAEEEPAIEHEVVPGEIEEEIGDEDSGAVPLEAIGGGHNTEERHAIAEQPTEFFDVEAEMGTEDAPAPAAPSPSDEEIAEVEAAEPKLAPVEPPTEIHASRAEPPLAPVADEEEEDEEFWSDQRLSEELDNALEAPAIDEYHAPEPAPEPAAPLSDRDEEDDEPAAEEPREQTDYDPDTGHEDVLEDTPDFLENAPEDDELWFEQRPPKDFDFDD